MEDRGVPREWNDEYQCLLELPSGTAELVRYSGGGNTCVGEVVRPISVMFFFFLLHLDLLRLLRLLRCVSTLHGFGQRGFLGLSLLALSLVQVVLVLSIHDRSSISPQVSSRFLCLTTAIPAAPTFGLLEPDRRGVAYQPDHTVHISAPLLLVEGVLPLCRHS